MLEVKEYKFFKTAKKTISENNLHTEIQNYGENTIIFDFSLLDNIEVLEDVEKEAIKKNALRDVSIAFPESFTIYNKDNFTVLDCFCAYHIYKVYNKSGKRLYALAELSYIKYFHGERNSVYDKYFTENIIENVVESKSNAKQQYQDIEL